MRTYAAIDVGSNSILLLIAEVIEGAISRTVLAVKETPRIAAGLRETGLIEEAAIIRLVRSVKRFRLLCDRHSVERLSCYGTSALREAGNSGEVISRVRSETGISIKIISGRREAALAYLGAVTGLSGLKRHRVLIDAGGGSSEVVVADGTRIISAKSFKVGTVALTERHKTNRRMNARDLDVLSKEIKRQVSKLRTVPAMAPMSLVLSGGTPTAIQAYREGLESYDPERIHGASMRVSEYRSLVYELAKMTLDSRRKALAFEPKRADVITAGGLLSLALTEQYGSGFVRMSDRSLRHGQIHELLGGRIEFA